MNREKILRSAEIVYTYYFLLASGLLSAIIIFTITSCVGIIASRELDSQKYINKREELRFFDLPDPVKRIASMKNPPSDSLFYINKDLSVDKIFVKSVNRSVDGPNSNNFSLLKHGDHFSLDGKRFYIGFSANPKIYFDRHLYYTTTFGVDSYPENESDVKDFCVLFPLSATIEK